jgi:Flp pilus assembly protein TadG
MRTRRQLTHPEASLAGAGTRPWTKGREAGQIIVVAALAMVAIIAGVALVLEGGNVYANQRMTQNSADAVAHAGATVLAQRLGGTSRDDKDVADAMTELADENGLSSHTGYYVNVTGAYVAATGLPATSPVEWVQVGSRPRRRACARRRSATSARRSAASSGSTRSP